MKQAPTSPEQQEAPWEGEQDRIIPSLSMTRSQSSSSSTHWVVADGERRSHSQTALVQHLPPVPFTAMAPTIVGHS